MTLELSAKATAWWTHLNHKLRDERGINQTTEFLILLGVVCVVGGVVAAFATGFINSLIAKVAAP